MPHFFYLARCKDGSLYSGTCINLQEREAKHNDGTGAKYTRSRRPVKFIYHEQFRTLSAARKREAAVKKLKRSEKEALVVLKQKRTSKKASAKRKRVVARKKK